MFKNISKKVTISSNFISFFTVFVAFATISACVKNTELVGYTFKNKNIEQIKVGQTSRNYVNNTLGTPSVTSTYGEDTWYYISAEYETIAFFKPRIKKQQVVAISFDENNKVSDIKEYSEKDANNINISSDLTATEGRNVGIIGELLGNVGRFNSTPGAPKIKKPRNAP
jgi:outer membrane protein assembly factor BamE (lipoprotein component of BamABCDE complex)